MDKKSKDKHCRLINFIKQLPIIRKYVNYHVKNFKNNKESIISIIILLMQYCNFRIGKDEYIGRSSGISTIRNKNLFNKRDYFMVKFIGKKQVENRCVINKSIIKKILVKLHKNCKECFVFVYKNKNNKLKKITYTDVNKFLQTYGNFSSKFFRTLNANTLFIQYMKNNKVQFNKKTLKKNMSDSIDYVSNKLHHTKGVCKKSYLDPNLLNLYHDEPDLFYNLVDNSYKIKGLTNVETLYLNFLYASCL